MRPNRRLDWVVPEFFGLSTALGTLTSGVPVDFRLCGNPTLNLFRLATTAGAEFQADVPVREQSFTILRVVGSVHFSSSPGAAVTGYMAERIHVGMQDLTTPNTVAFASDTITSAADAEERYLWQRLRNFSLPAGAGIFFQDSGVSHPYWTEIDLRVKRRMNPGEALYYSIEFGIVTGAIASLNNTVMASNLRVLCKM